MCRNSSNALERLERRFKDMKYGSTEKTIECPVCGEDAHVSESYSKDMSSPEIDVNCSCEHDGDVFNEYMKKRKEALKEEREKLDEIRQDIEGGDYHQPHPAQRNQCPYCSSSCSNLNALLNHILTLHKNKLDTCPHCGKEWDIDIEMLNGPSQWRQEDV